MLEYYLVKFVSLEVGNCGFGAVLGWFTVGFGLVWVDSTEVTGHFGP